jgi:hypothetical protein
VQAVRAERRGAALAGSAGEQVQPSAAERDQLRTSFSSTASASLRTRYSTTTSPVACSSSMARTGVIPTPPAISRVPGRVRCSEVNAPYGPSTKARLPTGTFRRPALVLPAAFAVRRSPCAVRRRRQGEGVGQPPVVVSGEPPDAELARPGREFVEVSAGDVHGDHVVRLRHHGRDAEPVVGVAPQRHGDHGRSAGRRRRTATESTSRPWRTRRT